jgi:hypothetical protein
MQYSGTSFSDDIVNIAGKALNVSKDLRPPGRILPVHSFLQTNIQDFVLYWIIAPLNGGLLWISDRFKWLQSGKIQVYVSFSIVALLFYLFLAFKI